MLTLLIDSKVDPKSKQMSFKHLASPIHTLDKRTVSQMLRGKTVYHFT